MVDARRRRRDLGQIKEDDKYDLINPPMQPIVDGPSLYATRLPPPMCPFSAHVAVLLVIRSKLSWLFLLFL